MSKATLVIIKSMGIGDLVILIANIHAISKSIGEPVTVLAQKNTQASAILKYDPYVKEVIDLDKKGFFIPIEKKRSMIININNLFYRMEPNDKELRILASIISSLSKKKLNHN